MAIRRDNRPGQFPAKGAILAVFLLLGSSLTGCAQDSGYQDSLASAAEETQDTFPLPRGEGAGAPIPLWESVLVVCPYSDTDLIQEPFAKEVRNLDTGSTDSLQWLIFHGQNSVSRVSVERSTIDFCQGGTHPAAYDNDQAWTAEKHHGAWVMTPAAD